MASHRHDRLAPVLPRLVTPIVGVLTFGVVVWNRVDKWREDWKKEAEALPWAGLDFLGYEKVESDTHSVRVLAVEFRNPTRNRWKATRLEFLEPAEAHVRKKGQAGAWHRGLDVDWIVTSATADQEDARTQGQIEMRFERQATTGEPGPSREVALIVTLQEVSSKRRRHKFEARTVRHF